MGLVPSLLGGVSGILCTALMIVGVCEGSRPTSDVTIINESGAPLDQSMIIQLLGSGRRRKRSTTIDPRVQVYPGWKTQYTNPIPPGVTLLKEVDTVFFGFGNCPFEKPNDSLLKSDKVEDVMKYYQSVLRIQCLEPMNILVGTFLSNKLLQLNGEKKFEYHPGLLELV